MKRSAQFLARGLAALWAGFWLFFFIVESLVWRTPPYVMLIWVVLGLVFVFAALAAWRWEVTGGATLVGLGAAAGVAYALRPPPDLPLWSVILTAAALSVPPLIAGLVFAVHGAR